MLQKPARRAYSAEELLALRRSASDEPVLTIQRRAEDGAIRDHVVRGSRSVTSRATSSAFPLAPLNLTLQPPPQLAAPPLGEIDPNNQRMRGTGLSKDSPTHTIKKSKAEQILKQHGSPPNVRVTAGGRIVPSDQSPLCSPRYGYSAINKNGGLIKFAPGYPPQPKTFPNFAKSLPNGFVAQDADGKLCQIVDGRFIEIQEVNGIPQLYITAPNITNVAWGQFHAATDKAVELEPATLHVATRAPVSHSNGNPPRATQIAALEKQYQKLEVERRTLDKTEVLRRTELTGKSYTQLVEKRRELVNRQDELRRSIKLLQDAGASDVARDTSSTKESTPELDPPQLIAPQDVLSSMPWNLASPASLPQGPILIPSLPAEYPVLPPQAFMQSPMPAFIAVPGMGTPFMTAAAADRSTLQMPFPIRSAQQQALAGAGTARLSKNQVATGQPAAPPAFNLRSALNPMSPAYQPARSPRELPLQPHTVQNTQHLDSSVIISGDPQKPRLSVEKHDDDSSHLPSSDSSYATADFFPNNPRDHSLYKHTYPVPKQEMDVSQHGSLTTQQSSSDEALAQPEMERHNVNWNPTIPDTAFQKDDARSLGSKDSQVRPPSVNDKSVDAHSSDSEYAQGFAAGLQREPIGRQKSKSYLDGYCKGLLASSSPLASPGAARTDDEKPSMKAPAAKSAATAIATVATTATTSSAPVCPQLDAAELQTLKQAIAAPNNEVAILSPDHNSPSVNDVRDKTLGSWAKENSNHASNDESVLQGQSGIASDIHQPKSNINEGITTFAQVKTADFAFPSTGQAGISDFAAGHRTFSSQTQPAHNANSSFLQRVYPGHRVLSSPALDWKIPSSLAHAANHATGLFAQLDGAISKPGSAKDADTNDSFKSPTATKFREAAMPDDDGPPSPTKVSASSSPKKSPAKAKFAAIAGKAGIKVRSDRPTSKESNELGPMSPQERRRWRDVWKKRNTTE